MARKMAEVKSNTDKSKILVKIGEQRKAWLEAVARNVTDGTVTETIKTLIDQAAVEDPESYATRVEKFRVKAQLAELEHEEAALRERKATFLRTLEGKGNLVSTER